MLIYAHRGDSSSAPENTLKAFALAIQVGAHGLEFDVRTTSDNVPVVIHDRDIARTTTGQGHVDEMTLTELQRFDAGDGQSVPTLEDVLALVGDKVHLDIEFKQAGIEPHALAILARHPEVNWGACSFDWNVLRALRALAPALDLWPLSPTSSDALLAVANELGSNAVAVHHTAITEQSIRRFKEAGLGVLAWTVNDIAEARRLAALEVKALCTDEPRKMIAALEAPARR